MKQKIRLILEEISIYVKGNNYPLSFEIDQKVNEALALLDNEQNKDTKPEERYIRRGGNINKYFELTHTNFLVLPRTIMMDIPTEWQDKFVSLLEELDNKTKWRDELDDYNLEVVFYNNDIKSNIPEEFGNCKHILTKEWFN